jgi:hypothetical protein
MKKMGAKTGNKYNKTNVQFRQSNKCSVTVTALIIGHDLEL